MTESAVQAGELEGERREALAPDRIGAFESDHPESRLRALLEETDAALADCLDRLDRVRVSQVPMEVRSELIFLQGMLKAARVDLTVHYQRR